MLLSFYTLITKFCDMANNSNFICGYKQLLFLLLVLIYTKIIIYT